MQDPGAPKEAGLGGLLPRQLIFGMSLSSV